jgi:hypothetical protein
MAKGDFRRDKGGELETDLSKMIVFVCSICLLANREQTHDKDIREF